MKKLPVKKFIETVNNFFWRFKKFEEILSGGFGTVEIESEWRGGRAEKFHKNLLISIQYLLNLFHLHLENFYF